MLQTDRRKGLKTGMYYLRTKSAVDAIKFTVDQKAVDQKASSEVHKCDPKPDETFRHL